MNVFETHAKIVGDYEGTYALGVKDDPPAFLLRVEQGDVSSFPTRVTIHGVEVPVRHPLGNSRQRADVARRRRRRRGRLRA